MADIEKNVIIDFQSNVQKVTQEMSDLRQQMNLVSREQKQLTEDFKNGAITEDQYTKGMIASENQMKDYQRQMKVLSATSFKDLAGAFKEGVLGANSLGQAFKNGATIARNSLKMLAANPYMAAIGAAIMIIKTAFDALRNVIKSNDDAGTAFQRVLNLLQVPLKLLEKALQPVVSWLGDMANKVADFATEAIPKAIRAIDDFINKIPLLGKILQKLGIDLSSVADSIEDTMKATDNAITMADALEDKQRKYALNRAKRERQIAELREKAADKEKYDYEERIKFLERAMALEKQNAAEEVELTNDSIAQFRLETKNQVSLGEEQKKKLNELQVAREQALTNQANLTRRLNKERQAILNERDKAEEELVKREIKRGDDAVKAQKAQQEAIAKQLKAQQQANYKTAQQAYKIASDVMKDSIKTLNDEFNTALGENNFEGAYEAIDKLKKEYTFQMIDLNDQIADIWNKVSLGELTEEQANQMVMVMEAALAKIGVDFEKLDALTKDVKDKSSKYAIDTAKQIVDEISATFSAIGSMFDVMADAYGAQLDKMMNDNETFTASQREQALELAESQYHATIAGIILSNAAALGNVVKAAASAFADTPGGIVAKIAALTSAMATGIATVISGINQAKQATEAYKTQKEQINKKGYATGGYIEGAGTSTSDSIPARLSNGEAVINARSTSMYYDLLSKINQAGGGVAFPDAKNTPILRFASGGVANSTATIVEAVKTAVKDIQPVVSVKEITRVQNKLKAKEI